MFSVNRGSSTLSQPITNHQGADGVRHSHHRVITSNSQRTPTREVRRSHVPGKDFLCPPVLEDLLHQFWRGLQDNLPAREELNKILEFQSDELRWTPLSSHDDTAAWRREGEMLRTLRLENLCPTVRLDRWLDLPEKQEHRLEERDVRSVRLYKAVVMGDLIELSRLLRKSYVDVDVFYNLSEKLEWQARAENPFGPSGLWSLEYKRELTSPLCIAAAQGYSDCLQYLLEHGARPNLVAGGRTALHEACINSTTECVELLLAHGANPNLLDEDGLSPLHLCKNPQSLRCAKLLVRHGAKINTLSEEDEMPLQVAARQGLHQHVQLYLRYGAQVNHQNCSGETALCASCGEACYDTEEEQESSLEVCRLLLKYRADVNKADKERRTPLHKAARNVQYRLVELLLEHGAEMNALDYNGCSPLSNVLQVAKMKQTYQPHTVVQMLLNHGSIKVWPAVLLKVLSSCASAPKTVEIMFNSYDMVPVTYKWSKAFPEEAKQMHQTFYASLFALENKPRSLQHLCRLVLRKHCGEDCHTLLPQLPIPNLLKNYLLLEPEGILY